MSIQKIPASSRQQRAEARQFIDNLQGVSFPNSHRIYLQGSRPDNLSVEVCND